MDQRLTYKDHIKTKRKELNLRLQRLRWLLQKQSPLSLANKCLLYVATLRPVWMYAAQLWGCASKSQRKKIQCYQNKVLHLIAGAPWYVRNTTLHHDLQIEPVDAVIRRLADCHAAHLSNHPNVLAIELLDNSTTLRRLRRSHPLDLPS